MSPTKRSGSRRDAVSAVATRTPSKQRKGRKSKVKEPVLSPQEKLDARKDALIQEKKAESSAILDKHENMVSSSATHDLFAIDKRGRVVQLSEMFHLKERTLLLDYNPEVCITSLSLSCSLLAHNWN